MRYLIPFIRQAAESNALFAEAQVAEWWRFRTRLDRGSHKRPLSDDSRYCLGSSVLKRGHAEPPHTHSSLD